MKSCLIAWRRITLTISSIQIKKAQNVHFSGIQSFFFHFIIDSMRTDSIIPPHLLRQDNKQDGRLAQLGEHRPYKARVTGSSPVATTIFYLHDLYRFYLLISSHCSCKCRSGVIKRGESVPNMCRKRGKSEHHYLYIP